MDFLTISISFLVGAISAYIFMAAATLVFLTIGYLYMVRTQLRASAQKSRMARALASKSRGGGKNGDELGFRNGGAKD